MIEALLMLIVVSMLGFTGWYVYHARQSADKSYRAATTTTVPGKTGEGDDVLPAYPYTGWKTYTTDFGVTFEYPANWYVETSGTIVTVASIEHPLPGERGTQSLMPRYNNNLFLTLSSGGAAVNDYAAIGKYNTSLVQGKLTINGSQYCLVGNHNSATDGNPVTDIAVATCKDNTFLAVIALKNKRAFTVDIRSVGNGDSPTVAISLYNQELTTVKAVLASMKF